MRMGDSLQPDKYLLRDEQGRLNEGTFNVALGTALRQYRAEWRDADSAIRVERSHVLVDGKRQRPDILIDSAGNYPIAIECEYGQPAVSDAAGRLGRRLASNMLPIRSAIAVGIPTEVQGWSDSELERRLSEPDGIELQMVVLSADVLPATDR